MISWIIEWCAHNRFLVFTGVALLVLAGIWSVGHIPLDALPDISDVQVIIHTNWEGEPPNIIEDQVSYPIVTPLLAAPRVKAVRAQTMFNDSYVFVVFEDGTDMYWARSRVLEYMQTIQRRLPEGVDPAIGADATGAGWVYEYALVDHTGKYSLADLRSLQDWHLRYQLETVPGVAEVASIGGFVKQYQVQLDPNRLLAYGIPLSTVIDRVRASTNEVGGRVLEMNGARYMVRGLGYLRSLSDLENVPVTTKNGTPVLLRDLGTVTFGPEIREGVAEWQGEGEAVGGFALAIGVLIDAAIVIVENGYRHLSEAGQVAEGERRRILIDAAKQVGPALFFSLIIIVVSFLPVFLLEAQEGRMFRPLAWTKTLAVGFSSLLAITLVPILMVIFIRGKLRPESENPISRVTQALYLPVLRLCLKYRKTTLLLNLAFLVVTFPLMFKMGSQFMPPLFEGSSLYIPTALPGISITQASQVLQEQDRILRSFPEVETVFGVVGRSDSATDNAPLDMYDTTVMLKPREKWRPGMTQEKLIGEMDAKLQFPGLTNTWTMPVQNRLDMALTGIKTPVGMKLQGANLEQIQQLGSQVQQILSGLPQVRSVFAERVSQGFYINVEVNRPEVAK